MNHAQTVIAHHEICAAPDDADHCSLCGRIAETQISDREGWHMCERCRHEQPEWEHCQGCNTWVPFTFMVDVEEDTIDRLCSTCVQREHEARERAESDGVYNGTDYER